MIVLDWMLDADPSIRWQALRDLADAPAEVVAAERARVATEGWGARLLALQGDDGLWEGGALFPARKGDSDAGDRPADGDQSEDSGQPWTATAYSLVLLRDLGVDPRCDQVRRAVALVRDNCRWEHAGQPFFSGEVEPCINGMVIALGTYFDQDVDGVVARLVGEQLEDGGWNCWVEYGSVRSSFATTVRVLEGLLAHERATGGSAESIAARRRGEEYLLERKLFRRKSTGEVADPAWLQFSFPTRWLYDVLRALEYLRAAGDPPDQRVDEAIQLLRSKQQPDGTWLLENRIPARSTSRSRTAMASPAGGTRYGLCVSSTGTGGQPAERPRGDARPRQPWRGRRRQAGDLRCRVERAKGIEPSPRAWEARVLPLNYARRRGDSSRAV
jgi:hypothetical protein